jgi:hypothetical protein
MPSRCLPAAPAATPDGAEHGPVPPAGPPKTVVPGNKRLGRSLAGGLPGTDLHRINVAARKKGTIDLPAGDFQVHAAARKTFHGVMGMASIVYGFGAIGRCWPEPSSPGQLAGLGLQGWG